MSDKEELKKEYKRRQRRRRAGIVAWSLILILVIAGIVSVGLLMKSGRSFKHLMPSGWFSGSQESDLEEEAVEEIEEAKEDDEEDEADIPEEEAVRFSYEQQNQGELILVNNEHPYVFEYNSEESLSLLTLSQVDGFTFPVADPDLKTAGVIVPYLMKMMEDCNTAIGASDTAVESAYRSAEYQQEVYDSYVRDYGEDYAANYVAKPGYSEHHTGYAVDMGCIGPGGATSFSESNNAVWMDQNCYLYGFIRRYKEDKVAITGISNEAWHFRYVSIPHATYMYNNDLCLEEYLDYLKNNTSRKEPLIVECSNGTYSIWYTDKMKIRRPENAFTVSGDNMGGYIITENVTES